MTDSIAGGSWESWGLMNRACSYYHPAGYAGARACVCVCVCVSKEVSVEEWEDISNNNIHIIAPQGNNDTGK